MADEQRQIRGYIQINKQPNKDGEIFTENTKYEIVPGSPVTYSNKTAFRIPAGFIAGSIDTNEGTWVDMIITDPQILADIEAGNVAIEMTWQGDIPNNMQMIEGSLVPKRK